MGHDLLIKNGTVIDGSGAPRYQGDIGIQGGRIAEIGRIRTAADQVIDADGRIVAPGFIDPLTSVGAARLPSALYKVTDGVTTVLGLHGGPVDVDGMYRAMESEEIAQRELDKRGIQRRGGPAPRLAVNRGP